MTTLRRTRQHVETGQLSFIVVFFVMALVQICVWCKLLRTAFVKSTNAFIGSRKLFLFSSPDRINNSRLLSSENNIYIFYFVPFSNLISKLSTFILNMYKV